MKSYLIDLVNRIVNRSDIKNHYNNMFGLAALQPLLVNRPYLPFTSSSLKPVVLNLLVNDIVINQRRKILELGAGLSTVLMARIIQQHKLDATIYSVEHDKEWIARLQYLLEDESLSGTVKLVHCPLNESIKWGALSYPWYDKKILNESLEEGYDLILIDGPPAYNANIQYSRIAAFPFLEDRLDKNKFLIVLDDVSRKAELTALKLWSSSLKLKYRIVGGQTGLIYKGDPYNSLLV